MIFCLIVIFGLCYDYDNFFVGGFDEGDYNNIVFCFNFNYKFGWCSSLCGGYGIFYEKIFYVIYSDVL